MGGRSARREELSAAVSLPGATVGLNCRPSSRAPLKGRGGVSDRQSEQPRQATGGGDRGPRGIPHSSHLASGETLGSDTASMCPEVVPVRQAVATQTSLCFSAPIDVAQNL